MKNTDRLFGPQAGADFLHDALKIAAELRVGVVGRFDWDILPVVAEVKDHQVVVVEKMAPIGKIGVDGKTVTVREQDPDAVGITVTAHANFGAIIELDVEYRAGNRKFKSHEISPLLLCASRASSEQFVAPA